MKEQVLQKQGKALVIYGTAHFYRTIPRDYLSSMGDDIGSASKLEIDFPGRTFVVIPVGRLDPPRGVTRGIDPDFSKVRPRFKDAGASGTGVPPTIALPGFHR